MSEERMNPNFNLESCLRNKVNEAKRYLEDKHKRQKDEPCEELSYAESFIYYFQNVETILDLYKELQNENARLKYLLRESSKIIDEYTNETENDTKKIIEYRKKYLEKGDKNERR